MVQPEKLDRAHGQEAAADMLPALFGGPEHSTPLTVPAGALPVSPVPAPIPAGELRAAVDRVRLGLAGEKLGRRSGTDQRLTWAVSRVRLGIFVMKVRTIETSAMMPMVV
jgi:hypothetical protein